MWCVQTNATTANIAGDRLKKCMRVRRHFYKANIVAVLCLKRAQYCCATHRRSQNNKSWVWLCQKFDRFQTLCNKCKQVQTLLWFHAKGRNMLAQQCCVFLRNNIAPVCKGLNPKRHTTPHQQHDTPQHNTIQHNTTRHDKDF